MNKETIKGLVPPLMLPAVISLYRYFQRRGFIINNRESQSLSFHARPCHYHQLFIKTTGEVFPCCLVHSRPEMVIGHISDDNLVEKMKRFNAKCRCSQFAFRKANPEEILDVRSLNLELSLACQATCIMCCVDAPSFKGTYDAYNDLEKIICHLTPAEILVQGGEVLVQKRSIDFLFRLKEKFPSIDISLVTNGCVDLDMVDIVTDLFSRITISFVGFQTETYRKIMGLNLAKTILFAEEIKRRGNIILFLKYLTTPINFHEAALFMHWGLSLAPERIEFSDANTPEHINRRTNNKYWDKLMVRTSKDVKDEIIFFKSNLIEKKTILAISSYNREMFFLKEKFFEENKLQGIIQYNYG